jgi:hypothetical protein
MQPSIRFFIAFGLALVPSASALASDLPANDAGRHQLITVGDVSAWFNQSPDLAKLKAATAHTHFASPDKPLYKARYESILGTEAPIVAYLRPDGGVIYFADRYNLPARDQLFPAIKAAHWLAKTAEKSEAANPPGQQPAQETYDGYDQYDSACPDGNCPLDQQPPRPRFPNLRPFANPLDDPPDRMLGGWFSNSIGSGMNLIFGVIAMGFVLFFFLLLIGAMLLVAKLWK